MNSNKRSIQLGQARVTRAVDEEAGRGRNTPDRKVSHGDPGDIVLRPAQ